MSLWLAGYPKRRASTSEFGSNSDVANSGRASQLELNKRTSHPTEALSALCHVDGTKLARKIFTSQAGRCSHVFGL